MTLSIAAFGEGARSLVEAAAAVGGEPRWTLVAPYAPCDVVVAEADQLDPAFEVGVPVVVWAADANAVAPALGLGCEGYLVADAPVALVRAVVGRAAASGEGRRGGQLAVLSQSGRALGAMRDMHEIARRLLEAATHLSGGEGGSIWLWAEAGDALVCRYVEPDRMSLLDARLPEGEGVAGWVARHRKPALVAEVGADARFSPDIDSQTGYHTGSLLAVPLEVGETVVGVLEVVHSAGAAFDRDDLAWVRMLAAPAAMAIENVRAVRALAERNAELRERNDALDAFAHTVAHDLKRPLVSLVGLADIVEEDLADAPALVPRIARLGRIAYQIVEELMLLAQLRGAEVPRFPVDMETVVSDVLDRLAEDITASGARLDVATEWPVAFGHGPWIGEVWANLVSNALKYAGPTPGVALGADAPVDGQVCFWCVDAGPGLESGLETRVFEPFARASNHPDGVGLGLSIARRIIERLDGEIGVDSRPGQGARFWFTLPTR